MTPGLESRCTVLLQPLGRDTFPLNSGTGAAAAPGSCAWTRARGRPQKGDPPVALEFGLHARRLRRAAAATAFAAPAAFAHPAYAPGSPQPPAPPSGRPRTEQL